MKTTLLFLIALAFMLGALMVDTIHSRRSTCVPTVIPSGWSI